MEVEAEAAGEPFGAEFGGGVVVDAEPGAAGGQQPVGGGAEEPAGEGDLEAEGDAAGPVGAFELGEVGRMRIAADGGIGRVVEVAEFAGVEAGGVEAAGGEVFAEVVEEGPVERGRGAVLGVGAPLRAGFVVGSDEVGDATERGVAGLEVVEGAAAPAEGEGGVGRDGDLVGDLGWLEGGGDLR